MKCEWCSESYGISETAVKHEVYECRAILKAKMDKLIEVGGLQADETLKMLNEKNAALLQISALERQNKGYQEVAQIAMDGNKNLSSSIRDLTQKLQESNRLNGEYRTLLEDLYQEYKDDMACDCGTDEPMSCAYCRLVALESGHDWIESPELGDVCRSCGVSYFVERARTKCSQKQQTEKRKDDAPICGECGWPKCGGVSKACGCGCHQHG